MSELITDIHAHILPGIDDGPKNGQETAALLTAMHTAGVHRAFCTSHLHSPHFEVSLEQIEQRFAATQETRLAAAEPILAIGAENRLRKGFMADIEARKVRTLGETPYVLVEFDTPTVSREALDMVHELQIQRFIPIMAHPERNLAVQKNPRLVDDLIESGVLMQATASCFVAEDKGAHRAFKLAWTLLEQGKISLIASDTHNTTTRPPDLLRAYDRIATRLGQPVAQALIDNANAVWNGEDCMPVQAKKGRFGQKRKRFLPF